MKMIWQKTCVEKFDTVKDFFEEYKIGKGDLIFTQEFIYQPLIAPLGEDADILYYEKYGQGEPSSTTIDKIFAEIKGKDYKRVIAIGGGSVVDVAKVLVFAGAEKAIDLWDRKIPLNKTRELMILPTTCGTGSEVTNIAIAEIVEKHTKYGLADDILYADKAVLIPELISTLPYPFFLYSSLDALIHSVESLVSPKSNIYTELYAKNAIRMIMNGYMTIIKEGPDARQKLLEDFAIASNQAGIAFGNTGVGAVHACSYPLGGGYHVPHGEANYEFFVKIFKEYDKKNPTGKITQVKEILAEILGVDQEGVFDKLGEALSSLIKVKPLREYGMKEEEIETFADSVVENQQRLLANNYVPFTRDEIRDIFKDLY